MGGREEVEIVRTEQKSIMVNRKELKHVRRILVVNLGKERI